MKYLWFSLGFALSYGVLSVAAAFAMEPGPAYSAILEDAFFHGAGAGIGAIVIGCLGLLYKPNRFRGFMLATLAIGILVPLSKLVA